jgi:gamma-glutamyltranspeptidase/glutathione hydrolase
MKKKILLVGWLFGFVVLTEAQTFQIGRNGVVVSASQLASQVGVQVMQAGGNAVDAAVAIGFALAVVFPEAGNIGGGGFMLIRMPSGATTMIDFREKAPLAATEQMYLDKNGEVIPQLSIRGPLSVGVPGSVSGYDLAWRKYGTLPWEKLVWPAVQIARRGFPVTYYHWAGLKSMQEMMRPFPASYNMFFPGGKVPFVGEVAKYSDLAVTLQRIAKNGAAEFYTGKTAQILVESIRAAGGIISLEDLHGYQAVEREPLRFTYRGYELITVAPPSSGGVCLAQILKIAEHFPLSDWGFHSSQMIQVLVEAERRAYANRAKYLGDPDFVVVPVADLLRPETIAAMMSDIDLSQAIPSHAITAIELFESEQTTHYAVIDKAGLAVAVTTTLNTSYGSGFVAGKTGILLNNEMDDFALKPGFANVYGLVGAKANAIAPGKRMLSSMTPTMVLRNDSLLYVLGTPGGGTIITTLAQMVINLVDFRMTLPQAVYAPRFHHQWLPDEIQVEPYAFSPDLIRILSEKGYKIVTRGVIGDVNALGVDYRNQYYLGVPDWRRQSAAAAY